MVLFALVLLVGLMTGVMLVTLVHLVAANRNAVPSVPTPSDVLPQVLEALDLPERGRFYELGCGDGRVMAAVLGEQPALEVVGVDNNPVMLGVARLKLGRRARLVSGDIMKQSFEGVDRVFGYLGPGLMVELEPKLEHELPRGARLVSQQFPLPTRQPVRVVVLENGRRHAQKLYVYDF